MSLSICLICNKYSENFHDIYQTLSVHSQSPLFDFIERFSNHNLKTFPNKEICGRCYKQINRFDQSEVNCKQIEKCLRQLFLDTLKSYKDVKPEIYMNNEDVLEDREKEFNVALNNENVGNKGFFRSASMDFHEQMLPEEDFYIEEIIEPEVEYSQLNDVPMKEEFQIEEQTPAQSLPIYIKEERDSFSDENVQSEQENQSNCPFELSEDEETLEQDDENRFNCCKCKRSYLYKSSLVEHLKYVCGKKPQFKCETCSKSFHLKYKLSRHMDTHNDTTYGCPKCPEVFKTRSKLQVHVKYECGKVPEYKCRHCSKAFYMKEPLKSHLLSHNNMKYNYSNCTKYDCPNCTKCYSSKRLLSSHLQYECGKEPQFKCELCPKAFFLKKVLVRHSETHKATTFNCFKCSRNFKRKYMLKAHVKFVCEKEPQFSCEHCSKKFFRKFQLRTHIHLEHNCDINNM